jgi:hypothetical protein
LIVDTIITVTTVIAVTVFAALSRIHRAELPYGKNVCDRWLSYSGI